MKTIVLIGMMGAGKTTLAKLLAKDLIFEFIDIDEKIENIEHSSISDIFKNHGEKYFRELEKNTILNSFKSENQILSLGGGAFENSEIQNYLLRNATVIYLKTSPETILNRIKNTNSRPLLSDNMNIERITEIINTRKKNYEKAHFIIDTDGKNPDKIVIEITGAL